MGLLRAAGPDHRAGDARRARGRLRRSRAGARRRDPGNDPARPPRGPRGAALIMRLAELGLCGWSSALAWRSLASRPLRTALTVLGVALGVAVIAAGADGRPGGHRGGPSGRPGAAGVGLAPRPRLRAGRLHATRCPAPPDHPRRQHRLRRDRGARAQRDHPARAGREGLHHAPDRRRPQDEAQVRSYELVDGHFLDPADPGCWSTPPGRAPTASALATSCG